MTQREAPQLCAVILTKNEERNIVDCIESVAWADSLLVVDSYSTDQTVAIARELGATVVQHRFRNFSDQHNVALDTVNADWVLFVDADERVTPELASEIRSAVQDVSLAGWWIPRLNYIFGQVMLNAGCYPDYQLRLMRHGQARYDTARKVHERPLLSGPCGHLTNPLLHFSYANLAQLKRTQRWYALFKAEMLFQNGVSPTYHFVVAPIWAFLQRYFFMSGYKDGWRGMLFSAAMAYYAFTPYIELAKLRLKQWSEKSPRSETH
jgi:glycosyltransferase involved in cell wall biosynthesis